MARRLARQRPQWTPRRLPLSASPWKSGPHRIACIAIYRTIINLCPLVPLPTDLVGKRGPINPIMHMVRKGFRRNAYVQGQQLTVRALEAGYRAEEMLRMAAEGNLAATEQIHRMLRLLEAKRELSASQPRPVRREKPRVWAYPGAPPMVSSRPRPLKELGGSGRRKVPKLASEATGMAFLRFKKPQSEFLGRVIRDKVLRKQRRVDRDIELDTTVALGKWESDWDKLVARGRGDKEEWSTQAWRAKKDIEEGAKDTTRQQLSWGLKIVGIYKEEKSLWAVEKRVSADERQKKLGAAGKRGFATTTAWLEKELLLGLQM